MALVAPAPHLLSSGSERPKRRIRCRILSFSFPTLLVVGYKYHILLYSILFCFAEELPPPVPPKKNIYYFE